LEFFGKRIHDNCSNRREYCGQGITFAGQLSDEGCMEYLGCKGKKTYSDCPMRKWNSSGPGEYGVNWCIGAKSPCLGCVQPDFPDGMSPFYVYSPTPERASEPAGEIHQREQPDASGKRTGQPLDNPRVERGIRGHDDHN
jgi:Ni,Fe-hydrogenase I small subunit